MAHENGLSDAAFITFANLMEIMPAAGLGVCLYRRGELAAAEAHFRDATVNFPHEGVVFINLAQVLIDRGNRAEARQAVLTAIESGDPLKADYERTLEEIQNR